MRRRAMNDTPTPPSPDPFPGVPTPRPATVPAARPPVLTGAAAILMIAGALILYFGAMDLVGDGVDIDAPLLDGEAAGRVVAVVFVVQGCLSLLAGLLILRLRPAGRILGIVITAVGIVSALVQLRRSGSSGFLTLALDGFVLYALLTYGFLFKQQPLAR
jgi:hypothetical protein